MEEETRQGGGEWRTVITQTHEQKKWLHCVPGGRLAARDHSSSKHASLFLEPAEVKKKMKQMFF